jgi:hypothetical protein
MRAVSSHREACLHQARVYLQQARAFRLRRTSGGREAMSMHESDWFFDLLGFAARQRDLADGLPGRWWRMPSGLVFKMDSGFNNVMCIDIPAFRAPGRGPWYGVRPSTIRLSKYRAFLERCECLGDTVPTDLIRAQVRRLEALGRWQPVPILRGDSYGDETETQADPACQLELFA